MEYLANEVIKLIEGSIDFANTSRFTGMMFFFSTERLMDQMISIFEEEKKKMLQLLDLVKSQLNQAERNSTQSISQNNKVSEIDLSVMSKPLPIIKKDNKEKETQTTTETKEKYVQTEVISSSGEYDDEEEYDCKIETTSLGQLYSCGWKIIEKTTSNPECCVVGVLGKCNSGKSFLLNYLLQKPILHGANVHTSGLSVIPSQNPNDPLTFIDFNCFSYTFNIGGFGKRIDEQAMEANLSLTDMKNYDEKSVMDYKAHRQILEHFILDQANVLLITINDLTIEDEIFLQKIRHYFLKHRSQGRIFVIHNLYHLEDKKKVEETIQNKILTLFNLKPYVIPNNDDDKINVQYYQDPTCGEIQHLVMAKENTPAGDCYNPKMRNFIWRCLKGTSTRKKFDIVIKLQEHLEKNLPKYMKFEGEPESLIQIGQDSKSQNKTLKCRLKPIGKKIHFNAFGEALTYNGEVSMNYDLVETASNIILTIELAGMPLSEVAALKGMVIKKATGYYLEIKGEKLREVNGNIHSTVFSNREFGRFEIKSPLLEIEKYEILNPFTPERKQQDGLLIFRWGIRPSESLEGV